MKASPAVSENQGWGRIMSFYAPKYLAVLTFFTAILNSFAFPLLGLVQAKFCYILFSAYYGAPNFVKERDEWLIYWAIMCVFIGVFNGSERMLLGVTGENLTCNVRK